MTEFSVSIREMQEKCPVLFHYLLSVGMDLIACDVPVKWLNDT